MPGPTSFPPDVRVRKAAEFRAVRNARRSVRDGVLELGWRRREGGPTRFGTIVPIRGLGAVGRNRIKRVLRSVFRARRATLPAGFDLVVLPRDRVAAQDFARAAASFDALVAKLRERERT